jgi:uncharacterized membrane protein
MTIQNPVLWSWQHIQASARALGAVPAEDYWAGENRAENSGRREVVIRRIALADLRAALAKGVADFGANRTDVLFLCLVYPAVGLVLERVMFGHGAVQILFPLASGFAILGPFLALGLYEMSRHRERDGAASWTDAFRVLGSPAIGRIALLGAALIVIFLLWLVLAQVIYTATLGASYGLDAPAPTLAQFLHDALTTKPGWMMTGIGVVAGFCCAVVAFLIGVVSFPLLLDRDVGLNTAVATSILAVAANPGPMAAWAAIVAGALVLGSLPFLLGLIVVLPVLGHATWHLYRALVPRRPGA